MDADLLGELYAKYYTSAVLYCLSLCGEDHLAQDLASDAFVKAYLSLPNDVPSFRFWLLRVCKNLWIDHLRKRKWECSAQALDHLADHATPENIYLQNEQKRCLWNTISQLPPQDRELITLHYLSGLSLLEASRIMGKSYDAVRQQMVRLRKTLKSKLEELGYGELE